MCSLALCREYPPLKIQKFADTFLHDLGLQDIALLKETAIQYQSYFSALELAESLSDVVEEEKLAKSPVVSALTDESTDISNHKRLVLYTQITDEEMKPSTHFVTNVGLKQATGEAITNVLVEEFDKRGVKPQKIISLGSDGASVMTGTKTGIPFNKKAEVD